MSDITINTSIKEGIALTSYESLAMGVPVVSSDVGGQSELITEDVGVMVPCLQDEKEILNFNYTDEEIQNYVDSINKVLSRLNVYKSNCRRRILDEFTTDKMVKNMEREFVKIVSNPNEEKVMNGKLLSENIDVLKELVSVHLISAKPEYEWLANEFNRKNIHKKDGYDKRARKLINYEHTLEYKLKHPIVVFLRGIGVYNKMRKILKLRYNYS